MYTVSLYLNWFTHVIAELPTTYSKRLLFFVMFTSLFTSLETNSAYFHWIVIYKNVTERHDCWKKIIYVRWAIIKTLLLDTLETHLWKPWALLGRTMMPAAQ